MRFLVLPVLLVVLSGCIPPGLTVASYAVDGVSYLGTGKSLTDHMLSDMMGRDCATWRVIKSRPICRDFTPREVAERKRNRDDIRHDVGEAYIATNLDGIDLDGGGVAATSRSHVNATGAGPAAAGERRAPGTPHARGNPVRLRPAPVKRQDLPPAAGAGTRPLVKRRGPPVAVRHTPDIRRSPDAGRYLVFGSFRRRAEAVRFADRHAVMQPAILAVRVRGQRYYRVVVRRDGRQALATARHKLRRSGVTDTFTMRICRPGRGSGHCMKPIATTHHDGRSAARPVTGGG